MSDIYELAKCEQPQDLNTETPYENKQFNFINDINSGVYTNSQQSLVQFDLTSIYNSGNFIDISQMYLIFPMVYTAAFTGTIAPAVVPVVIAPTAGAGSEWLITPKSGSWNLIQSLEVMVDGTTVIQQQPNINIHTGFQMLSKMSKDDLATLGKTLGMYPDDVQSYFFNGAASSISATVGPVGGNGLSNNQVFPVISAGTTLTPNGNQQSQFGNAYTQGEVYNSGLQERSKRIAQNATTSGNNFIAGAGQDATTSLFSVQQIQNEFRPYYSVNADGYMTWIDFAVVRLCDVCDFFDKAPLSKNFNGLLRIYINTGYMNIQLNKVTAGMSLSQQNSSFNNTCPFTINQLPINKIPTNVANLAVSANLVRSTVNQKLDGAVLALGGGQNQMNACRCYFPIVKLKPQIALKYINENRAKKIVFTNVLSNLFQNIQAGNPFSQLIQSGVRNIKGILLVPFISQAEHGKLNAGAHPFAPPIVPFSPIASPFDTAPNTTPMSLTQLNVAIGGVNQLMNFYNYTYENFIQQVNLHDNINASDMGISCGLISQVDWENAMRFYYIDCGRASLADQNTARNVTISFQNNSLQNIDVWSFVEIYDERILDVETGMLN